MTRTRGKQLPRLSQRGLNRIPHNPNKERGRYAART